MKFIAVYRRVSSKQQDLRSQEPDLKRWAEAQNEPIRWYSDHYSGRTMDRPGWSKLERDILAGRVSKVVVWRLDRLGRTARGLTALFEELRQRGVVLVSLKEGLDLSTPAGRMMANVLASMAQFETEIRAERILAGQAAARAKGKRWGGSEKGRRLKVTEDQAAVIRRMSTEGATKAAMARATGLSRPTVYSILQSKA